MSDDAALWSKVDGLTDALADLRVEIGRQDYRVQMMEQRVERVVEKIAEARGEAHNEATRMAAQLDQLIAEQRQLREAVSQAEGGLRVGKWIAGILLGLAAIGATVGAAFKGGG